MVSHLDTHLFSLKAPENLLTHDALRMVKVYLLIKTDMVVRSPFPEVSEHLKIGRTPLNSLQRRLEKLPRKLLVKAKGNNIFLFCVMLRKLIESK